MNKQQEVRRVDKCIRKTSDVMSIRIIESGKQGDNVSELQVSKYYIPHDGDINNTSLSIGQQVQIDTFPVATILRINYHAVWVMYADGEPGCVDAADCKPVAIAPASVTRLEDLAPELQDQLLKLNDDSMHMPQHSTTLVKLGVIDADEDNNYYYLTERGEALVADYQRRQVAATVSEWQAHGFATEDEYLFMQSLGTRDQEVVALEAENARLQGDLAAAQAIIVKAGADMQALRDLQKMVEAFLDDYGDWMPDQHSIQVSDKSILALTNAFDAIK